MGLICSLFGHTIKDCTCTKCGKKKHDYLPEGNGCRFTCSHCGKEIEKHQWKNNLKCSICGIDLKDLPIQAKLNFILDHKQLCIPYKNVIIQDICQSIKQEKTTEQIQYIKFIIMLICKDMLGTINLDNMIYSWTAEEKETYFNFLLPNKIEYEYFNKK